MQDEIFEKRHLVSELASHQGYALLLEQLQAEYDGLEQKLEKCEVSSESMPVLAQWQQSRKMLRRLRQIPKDALAEVTTRK